MSAAPDRAVERDLTGWGRNLRSRATFVPASSDEELVDLYRHAGAQVLARGNGRAYGDAALNRSGIVLDMRARQQVCHAEWDAGTLTVESGMLLADVLAETARHGWTLPVVPGTSQVTVGGAVASDTHGKNHRTIGTFGGHVDALDLLCGDGTIVTLRPGDPRFAATVGGMGLTGAILRVSLRLVPRGSGQLLLRRRRLPDLETTLAEMEASTSAFSVAWIDLLSRHGLGRSVLSDADAFQGPIQEAPVHVRPRLRLPVDLPSRTVNARTVQLFNRAYFHRAPVDGTSKQTAEAFHYPLDAVHDWNRAYGKPGFVQYQFVVPPTDSGSVTRAAELFRASGVPGFLAVLKRMGPVAAGMLSYPRDGWSLAVDIPARHPDLRPLVRRLDEIVLAAGGRVYLTKDSSLDQATFEAMYPEHDVWRAVRDQLDPGHRVSSDLGRRLGLVPRAH